MKKSNEIYNGSDIKNTTPVVFKSFNKKLSNENTIVVGRTGKGICFTGDYTISTEDAIEMIKYRIATATQTAGKGENGKAFEDMEMAIKALEMQKDIQNCISNNIGIDIQKLINVMNYPD